MLSPAADLLPADIFSPFLLSRRPSVVIAVSGGSDSTALLLRLKRHVEAAGLPTRLIAATVDHGLRPESRSEAQALAALCLQWGVEHRTIRWTEAKPRSGLPAAARLERYRLLAGLAQSCGTDLVLTGHTADDQAETVAMRRARGAGRGLAGMAPATLFDGRVWIGRPLLGSRREALRQELRQLGIPWIEDPTNRDPAYERARLRTRLSEDRRSVDELLGLAEQAAVRRVELGRRAAALIRAHAGRPVPGLIRLDPAFLNVADGEAALYALRILLAVCGGAAQLPPADLVAALLAKGRTGAPRATLSHCLVDIRRAGMFLVREGRGLPQAAALAGRLDWDGRWRIVPAPGERELVAAPLGSASVPADLPASAPASLARAALATGPALWRGGTFIGMASELPEAVAATALLAPWAQFLPCFDLDPARAAAELVGAPLPPEPPLAPSGGHIAA